MKKNHFLYKKIIVFLVADTIIIAISLLGSFFLRFEGSIPAQYFPNIWFIIGIFAIITLPTLWWQKLYSFTWAFVSSRELIKIIKSVSLASLVFIAIFVLIPDTIYIFNGFPRSIIVLNYILTIVLISALRFAKRFYLDLFIGKNKEGKRTLIVGAGETSSQLLRGMLHSKKSNYYPILLVDNNPNKLHTYIHDIEVLGSIKDIPKLVEQNKIENIIISLSSSEVDLIKKATYLSRDAGVKNIKIMPEINAILSGKIALEDIREVRLEDLLGRPPAQIATDEINLFIAGKKILVTGAAGSIGSELCRQIIKFNPEKLILIDQNESELFNIIEEIKHNFPNLKYEAIIADIRDKIKTYNLLKTLQPNIIFHAAAYKHVPLMEENPDEAINNNSLGTLNMALSAQKNNVEKFVLISTDKAVNPVSVMGKTKRLAEMLISSLQNKGETKFISVRFGNVLGSRGSVIPTFQKQIKMGGPVKLTDKKMERYFMTIPESVLLVMEAGAIGEDNDIYILDMGEPVKIIDLAKELIKLSGFEPYKDIPIVFTGIRPGEKLKENILTAEEGTIATKYEKLYKVKNKKYDYQKLFQKLSNLQKLSFDKDKLKKELNKIINI